MLFMEKKVLSLTICRLKMRQLGHIHRQSTMLRYSLRGKIPYLCLLIQFGEIC